MSETEVTTEAATSDAKRPSAAACSTAAMSKRCGDCGKFVSRERWVRTMSADGRMQHALCRICQSAYDGPEYH